MAFEDSGAGIAAAKAAGMRVVGVGPRAAEHRPDLAVADLTALRVAMTDDGAFALHLAD